MKKYILYGASYEIEKFIIPKCVKKIKQDKSELLYVVDINDKLWNGEGG